MGSTHNETKLDRNETGGPVVGGVGRRSGVGGGGGGGDGWGG